MHLLSQIRYDIEKKSMNHVILRLHYVPGGHVTAATFQTTVSKTG